MLAFAVCHLTRFHLSSLETSLFITIGPKRKENALYFLHRALLYADLQLSVTRVALTTEVRTSTTFILLTSA